MHDAFLLGLNIYTEACKTKTSTKCKTIKLKEVGCDDYGLADKKSNIRYHYYVKTCLNVTSSCKVSFCLALFLMNTAMS
jgi:hypothetical protein